MENINCSVCREKYDSSKKVPFALYCSHTFCSLCIQNFGGRCPTCNLAFNSQKINKNFIILKLIEDIELITLPKTEVKTSNKHRDQEACSIHGRETDKFCRTCAKLLCYDCICPHIDKNVPKQVMKSEAQKMLQQYKQLEKLGKKKVDLISKVDDCENPELSEKIAQAELELKKIDETKERGLQQVREEKENAIRIAEEEAEREIREISAQLLSDEEQITNQARITIQDIVLERKNKNEDLNKKLRNIEAQEKGNRLLLKQRLSKLE